MKTFFVGYNHTKAFPDLEFSRFKIDTNHKISDVLKDVESYNRILSLTLCEDDKIYVNFNKGFPYYKPEFCHLLEGFNFIIWVFADLCPFAYFLTEKKYSKNKELLEIVTDINELKHILKILNSYNEEEKKSFNNTPNTLIMDSVISLFEKIIVQIH
ncbi:hypothetical protein [Fusobacterium sp.]|uniref:hypothetical protein n=1 Tax=Fusobacterium sp. TaxID=68766 RepID=UPI0025B9C851|nr:hypothetical protein [Fusobacterium sp.]MCI7224237.1 hypothetical protein [Fusobacterium sp.]